MADALRLSDEELQEIREHNDEDDYLNHRQVVVDLLDHAAAQDRDLADAREIMVAAHSHLFRAAKGYTPTVRDTNGCSKTAARIRRWLAATAQEGSDG